MEPKTNILPRYVHIARVIAAKANCDKPGAGNREWSAIWGRVLELLCADLPSGSGFDSGSSLCQHSKPDGLRFDTAFHHMNEGGYYDGWTYHSIRVRPSLQFGFLISITGANRNDIKEMIAEIFNQFLSAPVDLDPLILQARDDEASHLRFVNEVTAKDAQS